ncbi:hypothetical protein Lalb_Chr01g0015411 [Lupinus albus]|uniref:Uncharacterized protein n=1 Tax=Lupinus albus TaxID=3870 RepID=A0A6A4R3J9_LUPAL|nr:hypothetical protein Lalb_Chr01g0015411 [Lupinus albus]
MIKKQKNINKQKMGGVTCLLPHSRGGSGGRRQQRRRFSGASFTSIPPLQ